MFITYLPGKVGFYLRYRYWKKRLKYLGEKVKIDVGVYFQKPNYISLDNNCWIDRSVIILAGKPRDGRITLKRENNDIKINTGEVYIGKNSHIAPNCVLSGMGGLYIGNNTGIASNSTIYSYSHHYRNLLNSEDIQQYSFTPLARDDQQAMIQAPVFIGDYCAVGLNSTILPGASLEKGTWVASNTVVTGRYSKQSLLQNNQSISIKELNGLTIKE